MKYLKVTAEELQKIKNAAIKFEEYETPLDMFCKEEAYFRVNAIEDESKNKIDETVKQKIIDEVYSKLYDTNETMIDSEYIEEITCSIITDHIPNYFNN